MALTVYWNPTSGDNSNNGLTPATARKYLRSCRAITGVTEIILVNGTHLHTIPDFSNQDDVRFKNGTAEEPIVIRGETPGLAILDASLIESGSSNFIWFSSVSYWTMRDIVIQNVNVQRGIRIENCSNIILDNIQLNNIWLHGIRISGDNITVQNCTGTNLCMNNEDNPLIDGGWVQGFGTTFKSGNVVSTNITFSNCIIGETWGEGLAIFNCNGFTVENCTLRNNLSVHLYILGSSNGTVDDNTITMNSADYQRADDLQRAVSWASEAEIDLAVTNVDFTNNIINGGGLIHNAFNFATYGSPEVWNNQYYDNIVITGNVIRNITGYGVRCQQTTSGTNEPISCTFSDNQFDNVLEADYTNIHATDLAAWTIENNTVYVAPNSDPAISLYGMDKMSIGLKSTNYATLDTDLVTTNVYVSTAGNFELTMANGDVITLNNLKLGKHKLRISESDNANILGSY